MFGLFALFGVTLVACNNSNAATGETVRFLTTTLNPMYVGEAFSQDVQVTSGTRPFSLRVVRGALPTGLKIAPGSRQIAGVPTEEKTFEFTLEVNDANLSNKVQDFKVSVQKIPPALFNWKVPPTAVTGEVKIPFVLQFAKKARSFQARVPVAKGVKFVKLEAATGRPIFISSVKDSVLRIDGAFLEPLTTNREITVFYLTLEAPKDYKFDGKIGFDLRAAGQRIASGALELPKPATSPAVPTTPTSPATPTSPTTPPTPGTPATPPTTPPVTPPAPPKTGGSK
jgi:Putative Ig domain